MAGKKSGTKVPTDDVVDGEAVRTRSKVDYIFVEHNEGEPTKDLGLTLNNPSEARKVQEWMQKHADELSITGVVRIMRASYC